MACNNPNADCDKSCVIGAEGFLESGMIPVPIIRYEELIKKEVELDLIYARSKEGNVYELDGFVKTLASINGRKDTDND